MDINVTITFVILAVAMILFFVDRIPADLVALLVVVALGVTGVLTPQEAFSGFSRSAVIIILSIFILAEALRRSGVTEQVGVLLLKLGGQSETRLIVTVMISGAFLSLFMNNIAAAAVLLPAVSGAARKAGVSFSKVLMPLAFSTILGGMATLLTTSNIILSTLLHDNQHEGFSLIDFAPVGIPLVVIGIAYIALIGTRQLPGESILERTTSPDSDSSKDLVASYTLGTGLFRARVPDGSFLIGKKLSECTLREDFKVTIVSIEREGKRLVEMSPDTIIVHDDVLILEGDEQDFRRRDVEPFMEFLPSTDWQEQDFEIRGVEVVEAMLSPRSLLIGKTLRSAHFREKYGMTALAIWRGDQKILVDISDVPLQFGDALLLQGSRAKIEVLRDSRDLIVLISEETEAITVPTKGRAALMIVVATFAIAIFEPEITGAVMLGGALAMMLTGILTTEQAYASVSWKTVFLVAGILPLGIALTKTNAAGIVAEGILSVLGPFGSITLFGGIFLATVFLVQAMNGAAAAAVIGPIAINIATLAGINPRSMTMGVAIATSMAFITPLGHPVNMLVMSPGGYSFRDYMKVGIPLTVLLFVVVMVLMPVIWGL